MDIETQLINELAENGTDKARELFLKWQEQRIKATERFIEKLNAVNNNCDLANLSERLSLIDKKDPKFEILFREDGKWSAYDHQLTDMMREMVLRYNKMVEYLNDR